MDHEWVSPETTEYEYLIYEVDDEHVCWLTLNRPEKMNAINRRLARELRAGLLRADVDDDVNVIVIRGAGRGFCAGHDLTEDANDVWPTGYHYRDHYIEQSRDFSTPWQVGKPVIASVHNFAIGKGFELTMFCDVTIATSDVKMGYSEFRYGLYGHTMMLPYVVGMRTAKELMLTGREVSATEAKRLGLVTKVVEPDEIGEATRKMATLMARLPREMQKIHKQFVNRVYDMRGLRTGSAYYLELEAFTGAAPEPQAIEFAEMTRELGLVPALNHAKARYAEFEDE